MQIVFLIIAAVILTLGITPITSLFLTQKKWTRRGTFWKSAVYSALFIWFIFGCILASRYLNLPLEWVSFYMMGFAIVGCMLALAFWVVYMIFSIFKKQSLLVSLPVRAGFIILWIATIAVGIYNFQKPISIVELSFDSPHVTETTRFVYFADTQFGSTSKKHFNRVVQTIIDQDPEFIAFGGDLVDTDNYQASDFEALSLLEVPLYFITGNHEYYHDAPRLLEYLAQYPQVVVLDDERLDLWKWIEIIGIDYRNSFDSNQHNTVIENLQASPDTFSIFLNHEPKRVEETALLWEYDLQLYGHTHGGQFYPWPRIIKAIYGVYGYGLTLIDWIDTRVYTTSWAWLFGPNIRLWTQNEIVRVVINPSN